MRVLMKAFLGHINSYLSNDGIKELSLNYFYYKLASFIFLSFGVSWKVHANKGFTTDLFITLVLVFKSSSTHTKNCMDNR